MHLTPARAQLLDTYGVKHAQRPAGALYGAPQPGEVRMGWHSIYPATQANLQILATYGRQAVKPSGEVTVTVPSVSSALGLAPTQPNVTVVQQPQTQSTGSALWSVLAVVSSAAAAYHGYKRNQSIGWAVAWGLLGGVAPVITPAIAVAQGFGRRASS